MKNYKNIRKKPYLYGFTVKAFLVFVGGLLFSLLSFMSGFTFLKLVVVLLSDFLLLLVCKFVFSNDKIINRFMDNKLPKNYSDYE